MPDKKDGSIGCREECDEVKGKLVVTIKDIRDEADPKRQEDKVIVLENLIVDNFREQLSYLVSGEGVIDRVINRIALGTSGVAAAVTDTTITNPTITTITEYEYLTAKSIKFKSILGTTVGNGKTFQEAGLYFVNTAPLLATRVVFDSMDKSAAFSWELEWTITWS